MKSFLTRTPTRWLLLLLTALVAAQSPQYILAADSMFTLARKLIANEGAQADHFGYAVSVNGDIAVVGVQDDDIGSNLDQGSVYVFERNNGGTDNWGLVKKLTAGDGAAGDDFGYSVAVSEDIIVVGAPVDDVGLNSNQGSAYVFERNQGGANSWGQVKRLNAADGVAGDQFGFSVSVSGDVLAVAAVVDDNLRGSAYVFERNEGGANNWGQIKKLIAADGVIGDQFGYAVSVSADVIVVGAPVDNVGVNAYQGSVYLFERNQGAVNNWGQVKRLNAADGAEGDQFGFSVSVSGDMVAAGAVVDNGGQGSAYLFDRNAGGLNNWGQVKRLSASDAAANDWFGYSAAVSGDVVLVGAPQHNNQQGSAYLFERNKGGLNNWGQSGQLSPSDGIAFDNFGVSVSVSGGAALIGAVFDDVDINQDQGSAYVYVTPNGPPPELTIEQAASSVRVSWPLPATGFVLECASNLLSSTNTIWSQVTLPYETNATHISITVSMPSRNKFYRLRKP